MFVRPSDSVRYSPFSAYKGILGEKEDQWCHKMYCSMVIYKIYPFLINEVRIFYRTFDRDINSLML